MDSPREIIQALRRAHHPVDDTCGIYPCIPSLAADMLEQLTDHSLCAIRSCGRRPVGGPEAISLWCEEHEKELDTLYHVDILKERIQMLEMQLTDMEDIVRRVTGEGDG